ncbi:MAG: P-loop NTPase [Mariniphaga sp.]|nr:P-loop NTPase [Mariniphaga sp.]MDD4226739.1 P-loop NTPase [Mariniphaga sp.]
MNKKITEITILSGKGGTGKTSVTAALASLAKNAVFCDNDVDAADLHLIFNPEIKEEHPFSSGSKAKIDQDSCSSCGLCIDQCRFEAIHPNHDGIPEVNPFQCEGCRLCERICPVDAIQIFTFKKNKWFISDTRFGPLIHARMGAGEENSGRLVTKIRIKAKEIATQTAADYIINDGPPGIGCPVIASVTGTGIVLMVIEPTLSGLHDAKRLLELVETFHIPALALINKFDINIKITSQVEEFLKKYAIPIIGKIPFDTQFIDSMVAGKSIIEYNPESTSSKEFATAWKYIINY